MWGCCSTLGALLKCVEANKSSGADVWPVKEHFTPDEYEYMYEDEDVYIQ